MLQTYRPVTTEQDVHSPFWPDTKNLLVSGNVTPFVSNFASHRIFDAAEVALGWAEAVGCPLPKEHGLTVARVAQVYSVHESSREAKRHYLDSLKGYLLGDAQHNPAIDPGLVARMGRDYQRRTFSELAFRLGYPRYGDELQNPLRLLAELPLHTYITTSYHDFLEVALSSSSRRAKPVSEIYAWRDGLEHVPSVFDAEPGYTPTADRPLVYHLYGMDTYPESLVLTEDDHLEFLVNVAYSAAEVHLSTRPEGGPQGRLQERQRHLPSCVTNALSRPLLMIGYQVFSWEFRTLFKGLIQPKTKSRLIEGVCMQLEQGGDQKDRIEQYLVEFFRQSKFTVYWGTPEQCASALWKIWNR